MEVLFDFNGTIRDIIRTAVSLSIVGDESRDIEACRKVGTKILAVTWGFEPRETLEQAHPDYFIDDPSELLTLVSLK